VREIKASEFKAKCLKLIDEVNATGEAIIITKRGKPVVRVERQRNGKGKGSIFDRLKGLVEIVDPNDNLFSTFTDADLKKMEESRERRARIFDEVPAKRRKR
jgi:antitoxin (DNA-binding transcriptional repressor) of toxin-antitoxin stability system